MINNNDGKSGASRMRPKRSLDDFTDKTVPSAAPDEIKDAITDGSAGSSLPPETEETKNAAGETSEDTALADDQKPVFAKPRRAKRGPASFSESADHGDENKPSDDETRRDDAVSGSVTSAEHEAVNDEGEKRSYNGVFASGDTLTKETPDGSSGSVSDVSSAASSDADELDIITNKKSGTSSDAERVFSSTDGEAAETPEETRREDRGEDMPESGKSAENKKKKFDMPKRAVKAPPASEKSEKSEKSGKSGKDAPVSLKSAARDNGERGEEGAEKTIRVRGVVKPSVSSQERSLIRATPKKKPTYFMETETPTDDEEYEVRDKGGVVSTIVKAAVYIICVLLISVGLAVATIRAANDIFAFVKTEKEAEVTIPELATVSEIGDILAMNDLIEYPKLFDIYVGYKYRKVKNLAFKAGTYTLSSTMNYDEFVKTLMVKAAKRQIITLTFTEGMTVDEIIDKLVENGVGTKEGYIDAIQNYPYVYHFMDNIDFDTFSKDRKYRLEGYLFPDTYQFYTDSKEIAVIDKFLKNFETKFEKENYDRLTELGMSLDDIVILASIIEREAKYHSEFKIVSSVFHNRINSPYFTKLESDATIQYLLPEHKEVLTHEDTLIDHPYNTYQIEGLPPGAICNPGLDAISAALYPESTDYYYFVAATDKTTVFAKTLAEHQENINKIRQGLL